MCIPTCFRTLMLPVLLPVLPAYAWETGARTDVALSEIAPAYACLLYTSDAADE